MTQTLYRSLLPAHVGSATTRCTLPRTRSATSPSLRARHVRAATEDGQHGEAHVEELNDGSIMFSFDVESETRTFSPVKTEETAPAKKLPKKKAGAQPNATAKKTQPGSPRQATAKQSIKKKSSAGAKEARVPRKLEREVPVKRASTNEAPGQRRAAVQEISACPAPESSFSANEAHSSALDGSQRSRSPGSVKAGQPSKQQEAKAPAETEPVADVDLGMLKVPELRAMAKARQLTRYSKLRKAELIELLESSQ